MRGQLGFLGDDGAVNIAKLPALRTHTACRLLQQHEGVCAFEFHRRVGEMTPDVAQACGPQNGIGNGVQQHVSIRMAQQALVVRNLYPPKDQLAPFYQSVRVPAFTNTKIHSYSR